jgi:hypothetical protein
LGVLERKKAEFWGRRKGMGLEEGGGGVRTRNKGAVGVIYYIKIEATKAWRTANPGPTNGRPEQDIYKNKRNAKDVNIAKASNRHCYGTVTKIVNLRIISAKSYGPLFS